MDKEEKKTISGKRSGRGTHGSITKAGKVRHQTPAVEKSNLRKNLHPAKRNRLRFFRSLTKQQGGEPER